MADNIKFGRGAQFGDRISPNADGADTAHCGQCEAMLADALDGTLNPQEQAIFEAHIATCGPCEAMLADARRGAAWLEMLRDPRPEPPSELLERILIQTSGLPVMSVPDTVAHPSGSAVAIGYPQHVGWRARLAAILQGSTPVQPRLAMTMAMAFFSIALTMNLTGVRLRGSDLTPSGLRRTFYRANARVVQYYEGLRVVYELESRVHDLESSPDNNTAQPAAPTSEPPQASPSNGTAPAGSGKPVPKSDNSSPASPSGSSRRENLLPGARVLATSAHHRTQAKKAGSLV